MANVFSTIGNWIGKTVLAAMGILNKADKAVDADAPEIDALLTEGASVATLIPGIGPGVAEVLNCGVTVLGAVKATLDNDVALEATVTEQIEALAPSGYSFVLIKADVLADVQALISNYEAEFAQAKAAVTVAKSAA